MKTKTDKIIEELKEKGRYFIGHGLVRQPNEDSSSYKVYREEDVLKAIKKLEQEKELFKTNTEYTLKCRDKEIKNLQELNGEIMFDNAELNTKLKEKDDAVKKVFEEITIKWLWAITFWKDEPNKLINKFSKYLKAKKNN